VELMPITTIDALQEYKSRCNLVAYEKENEPSKHLANYLSKNPSSVTCVICPEGGFSSEEIDQLSELGFARCSLGNQILRAETASIYVLCCVEYQTHLENKEVD